MRPTRFRLLELSGSNKPESHSWILGGLVLYKAPTTQLTTSAMTYGQEEALTWRRSVVKTYAVS